MRAWQLVMVSLFAFSCRAYGSAPSTMPMGDVLSKLAAELKSLQYVQSENDDLVHVSNPIRGESWRRMVIKYAADEDRLLYSFRLWKGLRDSGDSGGDTNAEQQKFLWDGKIFYEFHVPSDVPESRFIVIRRDGSYRKKVEILRQGRALDGQIDGDIDPLPTIFSRGHSFMRSTLETVHGNECYVIDSKGRDGIYTVWVDPDHDFLVTKARVEKGEGDTYFGAPIPIKGPSGPTSDMRVVHYTFELNVDSLVQKDAHWVPQSATVERTVAFNNGKADTEHEVIQRRSIILGKLDKDIFVPNFPDGTRLLDFDYNGPIHWVWTAGKIVPLTDTEMKAEIEKGAREINRD